MGRPRKPSNVLEFTGAFAKDPQRRRQDAEGAGPFSADAPKHLPRDVVPAWRWVVERLPKVAVTSSDEVAVEMAARLLAFVWSYPVPDQKIMAELRMWLRELGMTIQARTKIPAATPNGGNKGNPFAEVREDK